MPPRRSIRSRLRGIGYHGFYRLPPLVRRRLVRLVAPTYTVGAVVLVQDTRDRLLLLRQPPGHGWSLPGGMLDRRERPIDCAARELAEETGLRVAADALSPATPNAVAHWRGRWVDFVYQTSVDSDDHELAVDGGEVLEARWHRVASLPPLTVPTARLLAHFGFGPYQGYPEVLSR
ncbi:MAG TPA: NUDIX hydrolase [Micromonosporaceae bacterium]|nr:NUDIX hydrolase [Micromonosporaceae bacterium]